MYKLVIGNVRVVVEDDSIPRPEAIQTAKCAIANAGKHGKIVSSINIRMGVEQLEANVTEKTGAKAVRKTIKQSMSHGVLAAVKEKLYPTSKKMYG